MFTALAIPPRNWRWRGGGAARRDEGGEEREREGRSVGDDGYIIDARNVYRPSFFSDDDTSFVSSSMLGIEGIIRFAGGEGKCFKTVESRSSFSLL